MNELNILCGASIFTKEVILKSGLQFNYICDYDSNKSGNVYEGIKIISYDEIIKLLKKNKLKMFLSNRYVSGTVKKLECYFKYENFKLYAFISDDLKKITEIKNITDYYDKGEQIKNILLKISFLSQCEGSIDDKILIYTMRKVGTVSIKDALDESLGINNLYLHSLNPIGGKEEFVNEINLNNRSISPYYKKAASLIKDNIKNEKKLKVITAVREPIARNLSFMFYNLQLFLGLNSNLVNTQNSKFAFTEIFEDIYYQKINHDYFLNWFDIELKNSLGIDIYEYPFDKKKGYSIIKKNNIELLILKIEYLDNCVQIIKEFTGADKFELKRKNSADSYWYKPIYDSYKEEFIPNEEHLYKLYNSRFMKYFYSKDEITKFYKKWRRL